MLLKSFNKEISNNPMPIFTPVYYCKIHLYKKFIYNLKKCSKNTHYIPKLFKIKSFKIPHILNT